MKIKIIDKTACEILKKAINNSCSEIASALGVTITANSGRYDDRQVTFKVECATIDKDGSPFSKERNDFIKYMCRHTMPLNSLGRTFTNSMGERYKLVGYKPRCSKYPFVAKRLTDGKRFKFAKSFVKTRLGIVD